MKILVPTKRVPDTDQKIRARDDGQGIDDANLPFVINPFDAIALEQALLMREADSGPVEVVVLGIGSEEYERELRTALAMGADRAVWIACPTVLDPWNVARVIRAVVMREQPDLVLMGKQAVDDDANQTGQFTAALLGWPQATFASKIEPASEPGCLPGEATSNSEPGCLPGQATSNSEPGCLPGEATTGGDKALQISRETDRGIEVVRVTLPAVVTADLRLCEPRYASLPSILKARKKPIERIDFDELDVPLEPKVRILEFRTAAAARTCEMVQDAEQLADRIRRRWKTDSSCAF